MFGLRRLQQLLAVSLFAVLAGISFAADKDIVLAVTGEVPKQAQYTLAQLQEAGVTNVTAREHDGTNAEFTGVPVEMLLRNAGAPMGEQLRGKALTSVVVIHAADQYEAAFSLAEMESTMVTNPPVLAWSRNGQPLPAGQGPLRLIVPGDKRQARWVRQVTAIEVVSTQRPPITNASAMEPVTR